MFLKNKYAKWYFGIISKALSRTIYSGYMEKHHIVPKSLGGNNSKSNLVHLTAREHFVCHMLLPKMTIGKAKSKMIYAAHLMCMMKNSHQPRYINSHLYEAIKRHYSNMMSNTMKGHPHFGPFKQTAESNRKRSEKLKGRKLPPRTPEHARKLVYKRTEKHRKQLSDLRKGVSWGTHSEETKKKMSVWQKGVSKPKVQCEHCGKFCSIMNHSRWHGKNCKQNSTC